MHDTHEAIRSAAILVSALDVAAADALLESMDPDTAARVRACVMELDEIDPDEEQAVIEQFLGRGGRREETVEQSEAADELHRAVSLEDFLANSIETDAESSPGRIVQEHKSVLQDSPFGFLESTPREALYDALRHEHPQAIAVVLAHVAPPLAAEVMQRLPAKVQADVARRIIHLAPVDRETLRVVESGLEELIGAQLVQHGSQSGLATMQNILSATSGESRCALVANMHRQEAALIGQDVEGNDDGGEVADEYVHATQSYPSQSQPEAQPPAAIAFDDFTQLSDADIGRVLHKASGRVLLLALAGASDELMRRVYAQLPRREAGLLRRQIEQQGPISLRDVEAAQRRLANLASALADEGTIQSPPKQRFTVAA